MTEAREAKALELLERIAIALEERNALQLEANRAVDSALGRTPASVHRLRRLEELEPVGELARRGLDELRGL